MSKELRKELRKEIRKEIKVNPYTSRQSETAFAQWERERDQALMYDALPFEDWYSLWCAENGRFYIKD